MSTYAMFCRGNPHGGFFGFSASYAFAHKSLGSRTDKLWLTSRIAFPTDLPGSADVFGDVYSAFFAAFANETTFSGENQTSLEGVAYDDVSDAWVETVGGFVVHATSPLPIVSYKWFILESWFESGVERGSMITCDGSWSFSGSSHVYPIPIHGIYVGCWSPTTGFFGEGLYYTFGVYVDHVKVGTTRWGNDVFEDDFASGDFSAWDSHTAWDGTYGAEIVSRPAYPYYSNTCLPFDEILTGVHLPPITQPYGSDYVER